MAKYNILIVDDEESRIPLYKRIFRVETGSESQAFKLVFATESLEQFLEFNSNDYFHCYIVDLSLDTPGWKGEMNGKDSSAFNHVLNDIGETKPVILLSSYWENVIDWLNPFIRQYNIISLIDWKMVKEKNAGPDQGKDIFNNVYTLLNKYYRKGELPDIKDNDPIQILFLSDLQFGERNQACSVKKSTLSDLMLREIPSFLSNRGIRVDLVVVTGDIAEYGLPSEYEKATNWLKNLCERLWGKFDPDRLLLVNGNHDYNLSINALNHFRFKYGSEPIEMETLKDEDCLKDYTMMAFYPYKKFLDDITNETHDDLTYYNDKFYHLGIRFLHLNVMEGYNVQRSKGTFFNVSDETFNEIIDKEQANYDGNPFTIILSHASPAELGYNNHSVLDGRWSQCVNAFKRFKSALFLHGHIHVEDTLNRIRLEQNALLYTSCTPTLLSNPEQTGNARGFKLVTLTRKNKKVVKVTDKLFRVTPLHSIEETSGNVCEEIAPYDKGI